MSQMIQKRKDKDPRPQKEQLQINKNQLLLESIKCIFLQRSILLDYQIYHKIANLLIDNLYSMRMNILKWITLSLVLIYASSLIITQAEDQSDITTLSLNTGVNITQDRDSKKYFQLSLSSPNSNQILLITASTQIQAYIRIYVITSNSPGFINGKWPDWQTNSQQCFYSSLDTCALHLPNVEDLNGTTSLTVYFTISVDSDCTYLIEASLQNIFQISVDRKYSASFSKVNSAVIQLPGSNFISKSNEQYQEIVISCIYSSYRQIGRFMLLANLGQVPNPLNYDTLKSQSLTAITQILKLPAPSSVNSSYFIIIQGQIGTKLNFSVTPILDINSPTLNINSSIEYLTNKQITYGYSAPMVNFHSANFTILPLVIGLYSYRGYGSFFIDYCNGNHNFTFQNVAGENGQVLITSEMRLECYNSILAQGGLLIENLFINILDVTMEFGYSISFYEGIFQGYLVPGIKEIGVLEDSEDISVYSIDFYGNNTNLTIIGQSYKGNVTVTVLSCSRDPNKTQCTSLALMSLSQTITPVSKITFMCQLFYYCRVQVQQTQGFESTGYAKYSIILSYTLSMVTQLKLSVPSFDLIDMNEYRSYYINVTSLRSNPANKVSNSSSLNIRNSIINGQTVMLTSLTIPEPKFKDLFAKDSDVRYAWDGSETYLINTTYPDYIYISILGDSQSIYQVQFNLNNSVNIPSAYMDLVEGVSNNQILSSSSPYLLVKYVSHIIPYTISFSPIPSCVRYGNKLPFNQTCLSLSDLPSVYYDTVAYFNITTNLVNTNDIFKFSIFVNSGGYLLEQDKPILIACRRACYELVTVNVQTLNATIIHSGDGTVTLVSNTSNPSNTISNGKLTFVCGTKNCTYTLNASLAYIGSMQISYESSYAAQLTWRTKSMSLPNQDQPKYFYMQIPRYTDFTSLIFYSAAADLTIYYNIQALNQNYTNTLNYKYPNPQQNNYIEVSYGDPLQEIHIVNINQDVLNSMKCKDYQMVCILTATVYLNKSIQYSQSYLKSGLGYYSVNVYQYEISPSYGINKLTQSYSLSYFTHTIDFQKQVTSQQYKLYLQPISNCRPKIQTEGSNYQINFYRNVRLRRVMPGQDQIHYRVLCDGVCMYSTAISNTGYDLLFSSIKRTFKIYKTARKLILTYQYNSYMESFLVKVSEKVSSIIVNKVAYTQGEKTLIIPSISPPNYVSYSQNTNFVQVNKAQFGQYLIVINYLQDFSASAYDYFYSDVIIKDIEQPTTILHNQVEVYTFDPTDNSVSAEKNPSFTYSYHSNTNFYIFSEVNKGQVRLKVRNSYLYGAQSYILNTTITNTSDPWVLITYNPPNPSLIDTLVSYKIECQYTEQSQQQGVKSIFKIHIQEQGIKGLQQLYPGIVIYDAFNNEGGMNCYIYKSGIMLGQEEFHVDLSFRRNLGDTQPISSAVTGFGRIVDEEKIQDLNIRNKKISPKAFRLTLNYYTTKTYKICFLLDNNTYTGNEYSIIINVPSMPVLYTNQYQNNQTAIYKNSYNMFQYISNEYSMENQLYNNVRVKYILINVINCVGQSLILGSSSYSDMLTGKMTTITELYNNNNYGIITALVGVPYGYYYIGVKSATKSAQMIRIEIQDAPLDLNGNAYIPEKLYGINWTIPATLKVQINSNNVQMVKLVLPTVVKLNNNTINNNVTKIVYSLYLLTILDEGSTKQINYQYSIDSYTRCPSIFIPFKPNKVTQVNRFEPIETITLNNPFDSKDEFGMVNVRQTIQFILPLFKLQKQSNISIKADLYLQDNRQNINVISYYYGQDEILVLQQSETWWWLKPLKWLAIISVICVGLGAGVIYYRTYMRRTRNVAFEVSQVRPTHEMTSQSRPAAQPITQDNNQSTIPTNRKPLNSNAGYGQFIDEA